MRLGVWQLDRLGQRRARNAEIAARLALEPVELTAEGTVQVSRAGVWPERTLATFRRAVAAGRFDFAHQLVVVGRSRQGVPGVHVVTPLVVSDSLAVVVERGWVGSPDAKTVDLAALAEPESAAVRGVLLEAPREDRAWADSDWPRYVRAADPHALAGDYPMPLFPLVLRRTELPPGAPAAFRPLEPPALTSGPHLAYAIQWFAFAVIAVLGGVVLWQKETPNAERRSR